MESAAQISSNLNTEQFLNALGLHANKPEPALICCRESCGFILVPKARSVINHLTEKHNNKKSTLYELRALLPYLGLLSPDKLSKRLDGSLPHPHLVVRCGAECKHCGIRSASIEVLG
jgi:hypothetical protein